MGRIPAQLQWMTSIKNWYSVLKIWNLTHQSKHFLKHKNPESYDWFSESYVQLTVMGIEPAAQRKGEKWV